MLRIFEISSLKIKYVIFCFDCTAGGILVMYLHQKRKHIITLQNLEVIFLCKICKLKKKYLFIQYTFEAP